MQTTITGYILGYIGIMEKKMETMLIGYILGHTGIREKKIQIHSWPGVWNSMEVDLLGDC